MQSFELGYPIKMSLGNEIHFENPKLFLLIINYRGNKNMLANNHVKIFLSSLDAQQNH